MLKDFNDFRVSGRLGSDIELRQPQGSRVDNGNGKSSDGEVRATFRLANSRSVRDSSTETGWRRDAHWFNVVAWGSTAESLARNVGNGDQVWIVGWVQVREYTDKNGQHRNITEVVAEDYGIIEKVRSNDGGESSEKEKEVMSAVEG